METTSPPRSLKATRSESDGHIEKRCKKYKKWSIGGFFRRKKKISDTDSSSSSEDADRKGFLRRRRSFRKGKTRESKDFTGRAMVNHPVRHNADVVRFEQMESTKSSEYRPVSSYNDPLSMRQYKLSSYRGRSLEDVWNKDMNDQTKSLMERSNKECSRVESSSDDACESSMQSKSVKAGRSRDGSLSQRSRASRTERYKKRVSRHDDPLRDAPDELISRSSRLFEVSPEMRSNNQWTADIVYYESSDYETKYIAKMKSASSSPIQSPKAKHKNVICHTSSPACSTISVPTYVSEEVSVSNSDLSCSYYGQSVIHSKQKPSQKCVNTIPPRLPKSYSSSTFTQSPGLRPIHLKSESNQSKTPPLLKQIPPQPPPRDPQRKVLISTGSNNKTCSYNSNKQCDNNLKQFNYPGNLEFGSSDSAFRRVHNSPQHKHIDTFSSNESHISNSDHSITNQTYCAVDPPLRYQGSTVDPEYIKLNDCKVIAVNKQPEGILSQVPNHHYLADKPRSRKPIHIAFKSDQLPNECYCSDSQVLMNQSSTPLIKSEELLIATDCLIPEDDKSVEKPYLSDNSSNIKQSNSQHITTMDKLWSIGPHVSENSNYKQATGQNSVKSIDWPDLGSNHSEPRSISKTPHPERFTYSDLSLPVENAFLIDNAERGLSPQTLKSAIPLIEKHIHVSPTTQIKINPPSTFEYYNDNHKGVNFEQNRKNLNSLEDALNELEAIYKSLKLDDDKDGYEQTESNKDSLDDSNWDEWEHSTGIQSDLSYKYNSTLKSSDNVVSLTKRSHSRRSETPNPVTDDMAYRRLTKKEKHPSQEKEVISQAGSFLLVSPTLSPPPFFEVTSPLQDNKEPDITYDDVVYRNIQHTNNTFKILDPQPPFGIPLWPVTPTPNSSYLCVNSKDTYRPTFKPKKYPDIVSDDLAFRNLRKDKNKEEISKVKVDQDQIKKSTVDSCSSGDTQQTRKKNFHKDLTLPFNRRLAYNNNNLEEELDELQGFAIVTDSNKVCGFVPKAQYAKPVILDSVFNYKDRFSLEDSNTIPQITASFPSEMPLNSSLTKNKMSVLSSKQANSSTHEIADTVVLDNNLVRRASLSVEDINEKYVSSADQTLDNLETCCHSSSENEFPLILVSDKNSKNDIVVSPDLCEELYGLSDSAGVLKKALNDFEELYSENRRYNRGSSAFQAHDLDQLPASEIIKLDTLCITEDDISENKQSKVTDSTGVDDMGPSLIDLCVELKDSSNFHFLENNQNCEKEHKSNNKNSTSNNTNKKIPAAYLKNELKDLNKNSGANDSQTNYERVASSTQSSEEKLLPIAKPIVCSLNQDDEIKENPCQPLSQSSDEDRVKFVSSSSLSTALSNEARGSASSVFASQGPKEQRVASSPAAGAASIPKTKAKVYGENELKASRPTKSAA